MTLTSKEASKKWCEGPWEAYEGVSAGWQVHSPEGSVVVAMGKAHGKQEANARLIAAAPALYEALEAFVEDAPFQVSVGGNPNAVEAMLIRARAALSLARTPGGGDE